LRVLNLYAGIGGNRALWEGCEVTAVELDPEIAAEYARRFPQDTVIVADAHQYLLEHFGEFDFIWSSPPCPSHSRTNYFLKGRGIYRYPDMALYQEILFLTHFFKGRWCVENVISYYEPLIKPQRLGRHFLWANFPIPLIPQPKGDCGGMNGPWQRAKRKTDWERNCVNSQLGAHVLECAFRQKQTILEVK
jgi:DNA (cytosine-5)-methyltransferase 1